METARGEAKVHDREVGRRPGGSARAPAPNDIQGMGFARQRVGRRLELEPK